MIAGAVEFFPHRNSGCFTLPEAQVHGRVEGQSVRREIGVAKEFRDFVMRKCKLG